MPLINYTELFHTTDYFKSIVPLFYDSIIPEYSNFNFSKINRNTIFFYSDFSKNIFLKKIIAFINDLKMHEHETNMIDVCILDIFEKFNDEFEKFYSDNLDILESYTTNSNHKKILSQQLQEQKKFIIDYIKFHTNLKQEEPKTENRIIIKNNLDILNSKYPYINSIVHHLNNINLNEYCLNPLDLKTWLGFFACYINTCNYLNSKGIELNEKNISTHMKKDFYDNKNSQYIDFINHLELNLKNQIKN